MESAERIQTAIDTKDGMIAYEVFLEKLMPVAEKVAPILNVSLEEAADWVRDQFLDLAFRQLHTLRRPASWSSFVTIAVTNRALTIRRSAAAFRIMDCRRPVETFEGETSTEQDIDQPASEAGSGSAEWSELSAMERTDYLSHEPEPVPDRNVFDGVSLRDRALLKLSYRLEPLPMEWIALSCAAGIPLDKLQAEFATLLAESDAASIETGDKIAELYGKVLKLQNRRRILAGRLDGLFMANPTDENAIEKASDDLRDCTTSLNRMYRRYHSLQKGHIRRIPASLISAVIGLSENDIHKVISRARVKIKGSLS